MKTVTTDLRIGPPESDQEVADFMRIVAQALVFPTSDHDMFVEREGRENITVARTSGRVAGGLTVQRMGMSFGARCVPMAAVRVVGVAPEHRSKGVGAALMDGVVRQSFNGGLPLSSLYPATLPVYRRAGYELAGSRTSYRYPMGSIGRLERTLDVREATPDDRPIIERLYHKRLLRSPGNVDRNDWAWQRVLSPGLWSPKTYGYIVEKNGVPLGYVYFAQKPGGNITDNTISVADFAWESADAGKTLLSMLADHRSMAVAIEFPGAPADPLTLLMNENAAERITRFDWMLRIVDLKKAIEGRGYFPDRGAELHLKIDDPTIPENCGKFVVTIAGGRGTVQEGGDGRLTASIRDLAPLYSGFMSAESLHAADRLSGDEESIASASRIFSGPAPWMSDMF